MRGEHGEVRRRGSLGTAPFRAFFVFNQGVYPEIAQTALPVRHSLRLRLSHRPLDTCALSCVAVVSVSQRSPTAPPRRPYFSDLLVASFPGAGYVREKHTFLLLRPPLLPSETTAFVRTNLPLALSSVEFSHHRREIRYMLLSSCTTAPLSQLKTACIERSSRKERQNLLSTPTAV